MNTQQRRFKLDMQDAGFTVEPYRSKGYYLGWAVKISKFGNPDDVIRATTIKLQREDSSLGWIIYPSFSSMTEEEFSTI